jgi:uncharacterized protein YjbI with pentapeptide repeats
MDAERTTPRCAPGDGLPRPAELCAWLTDATPAERTEMVLRLIAAHPQERLDLEQDSGELVILSGIDLSPAALQARQPQSSAAWAPWWCPNRQGANLQGAQLPRAHLLRADLANADLRQANLQQAVLRQANLQGALLEGANLQGADLVGANLQDAVLGEAQLQGALLEDTNLQHATLRFAQLQGAVLEHADLQQADCWGAHLEQATLARANLRGAVLEEAYLQGADLAEANLQDAIVRGTHLEGAVLQEARLDGLLLSQCHIAHIHLRGARLEGVQMQQEQLGGALGEELAGDYGAARQGYLALEHHFTRVGDPEAARWAYRKKRRMQKRTARQRGRAALRTHHWWTAAQQYGTYSSDQLAEWLCDYGESIPRVLGTLLLVFVLFTLLYGVLGSVIKVVETPNGPIKVPSRNPLDLAVFSLLAMTTQGIPYPFLEPRNEAVYVLTGLEAVLCIALTGLLGFVLGNRIRR